MGDTAEISTPVRAIIADDHPLVLFAIENLMGGYQNMEVVGRAIDATDLFAEVDRTGCDLVLMDLYMPGGADGSGIDAVRQFRSRYPRWPSSCSPWKPRQQRCKA
jgi:DNA-binding NarL/FixJ family response regulator